VLRVVAERECSILEVVPSLLRFLLEREPVPLPKLRWLIPTGEALTPEMARRWLRRYPSIPMLNAYGPTECSDDVTHAVIAEEPPPGATTVPIGFPIPGVRLSLIDGELHVGGVAVGRGYRNDPERTQQAFIPDPDHPGMRLYRTGDLARQLADGAYEYLGRRDHQVKLHGIRVELGEIEAVLSEHPEVRQVAAALYQGRLVAYHVGGGDLRAFASQRLPASLVPAQFVSLDELPLTPNGKLDRKALPAPPEVPAGAVPAEDLLEAGLVNLFGELVGHPVGATDDFYELGGDSLKSIELAVRIHQHYGVTMAPSVLAEDSTPRRLAQRLRAGGEAWPTVVRLQEGEGIPLFLIPGAGGSVVYLRPLARRLNRPVLGLTPPGLDGVTEPFRSVRELARHLLGAAREVRPQGPYLLAGHSLGAWTAYEMACLLAAEGEDVQALAVLDMPARVWGTDELWMPRVVKDLMRHFFGEEVEVSGTSAEQLEQLLARLQDSHLRGVTRMFRAEHAMEHRPEGHFPGVLHLLRTDNYSPLGPQWGWEKRADRVVVKFIPGDHMSLTTSPEVAAVLEEALATRLRG